MLLLAVDIAQTMHYVNCSCAGDKWNNKDALKMLPIMQTNVGFYTHISKIIETEIWKMLSSVLFKYSCTF